MITRAEFWDIMAAYAAGIWPMQIVFYIAAILLVAWLVIKPGKIQGLFTKLYLAIVFAWIGIMFYMVLAKGMAGDSHGNYFFGSLFILVAVLFMVDVFKQKLQFSLPTTRLNKSVVFLLMFLVFCYPVFGLLSGHGYTSLIIPGTYPCPTIAFALLLLILALPKVDKLINALLIIFAVPFTPFFQISRYGVYEDVILFTIGIYSLGLWLRSWRRAAR
jgi:hypothetical protein